MGRAQHERIQSEQVAAYLRSNGYPGARVVSMHPLGETSVSAKSYGYGKPLHVVFDWKDGRDSLVVRTMSPDRFGHERRADRFETFVLAYEDFPRTPRHIQPRGLGVVTADGALRPIENGEPFLVTDYVDGELYALDLDQLRAGRGLTERDLARTRALASYLAELHSESVDAQYYDRHVRDVVGSGEGIFGLCESYLRCERSPLSPRDLERIEQAAVRWRWELLGREQRATRLHGDFHPFNILFREGDDFTVLDCSRGGRGEPADDVCCLAINYLFFGVLSSTGFTGPCRQLWDVFWDTYLSAADDGELVQLVAPFFAWRGLVLASPIWYPDVDERVRRQLIGFIERLLEGASFDPSNVEVLLC